MKKKIVFAAIALVLAAVAAGGYYIFNDFFPKAEAIRYPEMESVVAVTLGCNASDTAIPIREADKESLLQNIVHAKPTRKQSIHDYPSARPYFIIAIKTSEKEYRYFVYEEDAQVYIEMPYEGIYTSDHQVLNSVLKYFEEG